MYILHHYEYKLIRCKRRCAAWNIFFFFFFVFIVQWTPIHGIINVGAFPHQSKPQTLHNFPKVCNTLHQYNVLLATLTILFFCFSFLLFSRVVVFFFLVCHVPWIDRYRSFSNNFKRLKWTPAQWNFRVWCFYL